jgi:hypothetical protein
VFDLPEAKDATGPITADGESADANVLVTAMVPLMRKVQPPAAPSADAH